MLMNQEQAGALLFALGKSDVARNAVFVFFQGACYHSGHSILQII